MQGFHPPALDPRAFVIDLGNEIRLGVAKNLEEPTVVPAAVRLNRGQQPLTEDSVRYAIRRGVIQDFEALEAVLLGNILGNESFSWMEGREGPSVLISDPILTPKGHRERLTQMAFEALDCSGLFIQDQGVLSVWATGRQSGCAVDVGDGTVDVSPVLEGQLQPGAQRVPFGGHDLSAALQSLLPSSPRLPPRVLRALRERFMRAAHSGEDFARKLQHGEWSSSLQYASEGPGGPPAENGTPAGEQMQVDEEEKKVAADAMEAPAEAGAPAAATAPEDEEYTLPDGQRVRLGREGFLLAEALFRPPSRLDAQTFGPAVAAYAPLGAPLQELALSACMNHLDPLARRTMAEFPFVCGGLSNVPGINERFVREVAAIAPASYNIREPPIVPGYMPPFTLARASFVGGCMMANIVFTTQTYVSKFEYNEGGPYYVQRKFS